MIERIKQVIFVIPIAMLPACSIAPIQNLISSKAEEQISYVMPVKQQTGSIYQRGYDIALFEDAKARRVGDIITIILAEQTDASKSASTSTDKTNAIDIANPNFLGNTPNLSVNGKGFNLGTDMDSSKSFSGEGGSAQSNQLTGSITATVYEVLPNGYLRVRGEKVISINQGDEYVRISGIIRPVDITPSNTVLSTQVANAIIAYGGSGVIANSNEMGWMAKFFNSKWWPF